MAVALVTGVSRMAGIGRAVCLTLARRGIDICFTYWHAYDCSMPWGVAHDAPVQIRQEIEALGVRCHHLEADLADPAVVPTLFDEAEAHLGPVSILINNATHSTDTPPETCTAADLDQHYAINIRATTLLCLELMRRYKGANGRIVNLSSGQSLGPMPNELAYAVTKAGVETLTTTLAPVLAARGITINAINPGPTDTGWMSADLQHTLRTRFPMGRIGTPDDAARLIVFLASAEADWITGQVIHSEGGFMR